MKISVKNKFFTRKFVPAAQIRRLRKGIVINMTHSEVLKETYHKALEQTANNDFSVHLNNDIVGDLELLVNS